MNNIFEFIKKLLTKKVEKVVDTKNYKICKVCKNKFEIQQKGQTMCSFSCQDRYILGGEYEKATKFNIE